jgi:taspase (threonine aspartase 1)
MNGTDLKWGAVGALQTIKNPISAAKLVLIEQNKTLPLGLVAPNILVGEGARLWAINNGCLSANLITG